MLRYQHKRTDKKPCNTRHISWDSSGIFCPLNVGFASWHVRSKKKNQHWEGRSTTFCRNMGTAWAVPTYCDEDCGFHGSEGVKGPRDTPIHGPRVLTYDWDQ